MSSRILGVGLLLLVVTTGCGYTLGYRMPADIDDVCVPTFANKTFPLRREIEFDLTRAVRQELQLRSDVNIVSRSNSDALLEGTVLSFQESVLTEGPHDAVQDASIVVRVHVRLIRTADGSVLFDDIISDQQSYSILRGESVDDARFKAILSLARRIVVDLEVW